MNSSILSKWIFSTTSIYFNEYNISFHKIPMFVKTSYFCIKLIFTRLLLLKVQKLFAIHKTYYITLFHTAKRQLIQLPSIAFYPMSFFLSASASVHYQLPALSLFFYIVTGTPPPTTCGRGCRYVNPRLSSRRARITAMTFDIDRRSEACRAPCIPRPRVYILKYLLCVRCLGTCESSA